LGYLGKRAAFANEPDVYYLGLQGRRYIAGVCPEYTQQEVDRIAGVTGDGARAPILMMSHELTLSSLYVTARLDAYVQGLSLEWRNSRMLELMRLPMQPDAYIHVRNGRREHAAFLEFTGVLPDKAELRHKIAAYAQYLESRRCRQDLGVEQVAVLWLTNMPAKRDRILEEVAGSAYRDWFLVLFHITDLDFWAPLSKLCPSWLFKGARSPRKNERSLRAGSALTTLSATDERASCFCLKPSGSARRLLKCWRSTSRRFAM
jgi:hypothetical protein